MELSTAGIGRLGVIGGDVGILLFVVDLPLPNRRDGARTLCAENTTLNEVLENLWAEGDL